jgi:hypothetical protein
MNGKIVTITAIGLFAALSLGSPLSAAPDAAKKSIRIDSTTRGTEHSTGKFILLLGKDGDGGKVESLSSNEHYTKTQEGLEYLAFTERATFTGKAGTFVLRILGRGYKVGFGTHVNSSGTWSAASGTGTYAAIRGRGSWVGVHDEIRNSEQRRYAGSVTPS